MKMLNILTYQEECDKGGAWRRHKECRDVLCDVSEEREVTFVAIRARVERSHRFANLLRSNSRMSLKKSTFFSGSMFLETESLDKRLHLVPFSIYVSQLLARGEL